MMIIIIIITFGFKPLTVPMHLGLISRPFVPYNLTLVQGNPVPLLKIQMAPRECLIQCCGNLEALIKPYVTCREFETWFLGVIGGRTITVFEKWR
jgi:hypothetical protein